MGNSKDLGKDKLHREKKNIFTDEAVKLVSMILDDKSYLNMRNWNKKIQLVTKAMEQLKDPKFILKQLRSIIMENKSSSLDVRKAESAFQELECFFQQSVPKQECADEISESLPDSIQLKQHGVLQTKVLQEAKEESQSFGEEINQILAILEQKHQSLQEAKSCTIVANILQKVVNSCSNIAANEILNQDCANQVQGSRGVGSVTFEIEGEQLRLNFSPTPDSIQINQKGKNAEVHNQEMIKQGKEVILTIELVAGRLAELKLATKITNQKMDHQVDSNNDDLINYSWSEIFNILGDSGDFNNPLVKDMIGTSHTIANEARSPDETRVVHGYNVSSQNADVLIDIFRKHPSIDENFGLAHPDLRSHFMNLLAKICQKISEQKMLELKDITGMEVMVQDMELNGLQLSWLNETLREVRKMLKNQAKRKRLLEQIDSHRAEVKKAELELAMLEKKTRFQ